MRRAFIGASAAAALGLVVWAAWKWSSGSAPPPRKVKLVSLSAPLPNGATCTVELMVDAQFSATEMLEKELSFEIAHCHNEKDAIELAVRRRWAMADFKIKSFKFK